jgi:hypothetical protein
MEPERGDSLTRRRLDIADACRSTSAVSGELQVLPKFHR